MAGTAVFRLEGAVVDGDGLIDEATEVNEQDGISIFRGKEKRKFLSRNDGLVSIPSLAYKLDKEQLQAVKNTQVYLLTCAVATIQFCISFHLYGMTGVTQNYLQNPLPPGGRGTGAPASFDSPDPAGALNRGEAAASGLQNFFWALFFFFPIVGAVLADSKWGRYKTILVFCFVSLIGSLIILITSIPPMLQRGAGYPGWIVGCIVMALGAGAATSSSTPFLVDQCQIRISETSTTVSNSSAPAITVQRAYAISYWCINLGSLAAIATSQLERRVGYWASFLLPCIVLLLALLILIVGSQQYVKVVPNGSVFTQIFRVMRVVIAGKSTFKRKPSALLDRAKPSSILPSHEIENHTDERPKWLTWNDNFIDELRLLARTCLVMSFFPIYFVVFNQISTNLVSMAGDMTTNGLPNDLLQNFGSIALLIILPIMDTVIYPILRRYGLLPKPILKMWIGFMLGSCAMIYSAVLQHFIYSTNTCDDLPYTCGVSPSSISVWVQMPSYILIAMSEIFTYLTGLEYAYNCAPASMKSVVTGLFYLMSSIGCALNAALAPLSRDPNLVWIYTGISGVTFVCGCIFYICFRSLDLDEYPRYKSTQ